MAASADTLVAPRLRSAAPPLPLAGAALVALVLGLALLRGLLAAVSGASLHVDEAQYWDWSRDLQWGYFSKPPAVAVLIAASRALFGDSEAGLRVLAMACWPLTALVTASLARSMAGGAAATWAALLVMLSPLAAMLGQVATTDALLMLAWALALRGLWMAVSEGRWAGWVLYAGALALGLLDKFTIAALLPGAAAWCARAGGRGALMRWTLATAAGGAALLPHLLWNAAMGWPTLQHTADITVRSGHGHWWHPAALAAGLAYGAAQVLLVAPVMGPWLLMRRAWRAGGLSRVAWGALLWWHAPLLAAGMFQAAKGHAELNWVGPTHLAGVLMLAAIAARAAASVGWLVGQGVLVTLLAGGWAAICLGVGITPGERLAQADVWARMRGWPEALSALAARAPALARPGTVLIADNRNLAAQTAYHWRALPLVRTIRPADGRAGNHYQLQCPWHRGLAEPGRAVLLITEEMPDAEWAARLGGLSRVADMPLRRWGRDVGRLYLWQTQAPAQARDAPRASAGCMP